MKNEEVDSGKRWCCVCAYDGTRYAGWQKQPTNDAVQNKIEDALYNIGGTAPINMTKLRQMLAASRQE